MNLENITVKVILNDTYKTLPYFSLEQAQNVAGSIEKSANPKIYKLIPNKTDSQVVLEATNAYLVVFEYRGRLKAYDNDGGFIISEETVKESLVEV